LSPASSTCSSVPCCLVAWALFWPCVGLTQTAETTLRGWPSGWPLFLPSFHAHRKPNINVDPLFLATERLKPFCGTFPYPMCVSSFFAVSLTFLRRCSGAQSLASAAPQPSTPLARPAGLRRQGSLRPFQAGFFSRLRLDLTLSVCQKKALPPTPTGKCAREATSQGNARGRLTHREMRERATPQGNARMRQTCREMRESIMPLSLLWEPVVKFTLKGFSAFK
jgi:hypothetical protein